MTVCEKIAPKIQQTMSTVTEYSEGRMNPCVNKANVDNVLALIPLLFSCSQGIEDHLAVLNQSRTLGGNSYTFKLL